MIPLLFTLLFNISQADSTVGITTTLDSVSVTSNAPVAATQSPKKSDFIMHHILDGKDIDLEPFGTIWLPIWEPIQLAGFSLDISPTKHTVYLGIVSILLLLFGYFSAAAHRKAKGQIFVPRGISNLVEVFIQFIRDNIAIPNIGKHDYRKFMPYLITVFFFVLFSNYLGLLPYGASITGNINVTATLAIITFVITHIYSRATYWKHIFLPDVPLGVNLIMIPVEILGMFTKPFALAVRLFANMTGGHLVILTFIGLIFILESYYVALLSVPLALFVYLLEVVVGIVQAYIFTILSAVYIGMAVEEHH